MQYKATITLADNTKITKTISAKSVVLATQKVLAMCIDSGELNSYQIDTCKVDTHLIEKRPVRVLIENE